MNHHSRVASFVAERKLAGLRAARRELHEAYDALEARTSAAADPRDRLRDLAAGLGELRLGANAVHPDLPDLRAVAAGGDPALVERWLATLRTEMRRGRARADLLPLVAGVLGEAARPDRGRPEPDPAALAAELDTWCRPAAGGPLISAAVASLDPERLTRAREAVAARVLDAAEAPALRPGEALLAPEHRAEGEAWSRAAETADGVPDPEILDLNGALRLWWSEILDWDWPAATPLAPSWTRTRWRLRPATDWLTAWAVEAVGDHLERALDAVSGHRMAERRLRLARLVELRAPAVILENERRLAEQHTDLFGAYGEFSVGEADSVARARAGATTFSADADYGYEGGGSEIARATARLAAEAELARAHGRALVVVKSDIAGFYPSVSHALVRELLAAVGVPAPWCELALRVLSVPLPDGRRTARGLPLGLRLSRAVGDLLVAVLVGQVRSGLPDLEVMTLVDDVVFLAPDRETAERAWRAWRDAVQAAGLAVNEAKSGSVELGRGPGPAAGPVRWGLLRLEVDGVMRVDADALAEHVALTRRQLAATEAVLDRVATIREQLRWVWTWLAPQARLDPGHAARVAEALASWWRALDPERELLQALSERFLEGAEPTAPRAWLHWPVTAGGLGLPWWPADLAPLGLDPGPDAPTPAPAASPEDAPAWGRWFAGRLTPRTATEPRESAVDQALTERFVQRAQRLGRAPTPLSTYWRWVLRSHGPEILDAFGTWDFVPTDLVPVELLRGR